MVERQLQVLSVSICIYPQHFHSLCLSCTHIALSQPLALLHSHPLTVLCVLIGKTAIEFNFFFVSLSYDSSHVFSVSDHLTDVRAVHRALACVHITAEHMR